MFYVSVLYILLLQYSVSYVHNVQVYVWCANIQLLLLGAALCYSCVYKTTKIQAQATALGITAVFLAGIDSIPELPEQVFHIACTLGIAFNVWVMARPYDIPSDDLSTDTVCLVFYKGALGTTLMHMFSSIGLPVRSLSVIAGEYWLKPVLKSRKFELHFSTDIKIKDYLIIDTRVPINYNIEDTIKQLVNGKTYSVSTLCLRTRCVAHLKPLLNLLGPGWSADGIYLLPSMYLYKVLKQRRKYGDTYTRDNA